MYKMTPDKGKKKKLYFLPRKIAVNVISFTAMLAMVFTASLAATYENLRPIRDGDREGGNALTAPVFRQFITDGSMFCFLPNHFVESEEELLSPSRATLERYKKLAGLTSDFINNLPNDRRNAIFQEKVQVAGLDRHLSHMSGKTGAFSENGGRIMDIRDVTGTIDFRAPDRTSRIPHFVYRISVQFPGEERVRTYYVKLSIKDNRNELVFNSCAEILGLEGYDYNIQYYPKNDESDWLISEEIPNSVTLEDVPGEELQQHAELLVGQVAKIAALNDALSIGNSTNLLIEEDGVPRVISIDHEFMLLRQNTDAGPQNTGVGIRDSWKGQGDIFSLHNLLFSMPQEEAPSLLRCFREAYIEFHWEIRTKEKQLQAAILDLGRQEASKIFEWYGVKGDPDDRVTSLCINLLLWGNKVFLVEQFDGLWGRERDQVEIILSEHAFADRFPGTQKAIAIISNDDFDTPRKIREISIDSETLQAAVAVIEDVTRKVSASAIGTREDIIREKLLSWYSDEDAPFIRSHVDRTARYAVVLAEELGLSAAQREEVFVAGLLHDFSRDDQRIAEQRIIDGLFNDHFPYGGPRPYAPDSGQTVDDIELPDGFFEELVERGLADTETEAEKIYRRSMSVELDHGLLSARKVQEEKKETLEQLGIRISEDMIRAIENHHDPANLPEGTMARTYAEILRVSDTIEKGNNTICAKTFYGREREDFVTMFKYVDGLVTDGLIDERLHALVERLIIDEQDPRLINVMMEGRAEIGAEPLALLPEYDLEFIAERRAGRVEHPQNAQRELEHST